MQNENGTPPVGHQESETRKIIRPKRKDGYIKMRIKFWRIGRAAEKQKIIVVARLLGVTWGDKTVEEFGEALAQAHSEFCRDLIDARWF